MSKSNRPRAIGPTIDPKAMSARIDAAYASPPIPEELAAEDGPEESGPPMPEETAPTGEVTTLAKHPDAFLRPVGASNEPVSSVETDALPSAAVVAPQPAAPDCSTIVANLDRQSAPAWPADSPLKVDWPWSGEPDPVPGDIVGWNWQRREIAVVTAVPPVTQPWPYTLTVEIRPMPEEWLMGPVKVFNLNSGQRLDVEWYTRWNRTYSQFVMDANGCVLADESGDEVKRTTGSGWLAVVQEKAGQ